ncbi:MFS transporter [Sphingosinicella sp. LHD-64]|uniref:MFS transporter n=1 Tax=Sphingosinicella sp. LHD-64 TaxID=3072139 RepID=UPI00280E5261|nr:MFS transporter [Sphingosinicella sp. LHD-64]MDQ8756752.1 MFS transporter [Sphingosinicella sp. LHD-64]
MTNPYREIFRAPGTKGFAAAGFVARLPIAMAPIGIVTMLAQARGEYWLAGAVAAAFTLTNAVAAPQISRLVDRFGQSRLLIPTASVSVLAFIALMLAIRFDGPIWTLFVSAFLAAAMPSIPAMVRARWTEIFRDRPELNTAFAFESAADELVYIAGASLSVGLSVALFPEAGVLASTLFLAGGMSAFVVQRGTEPRARTADLSAHRSAITLRSVQLVTAALIFVGAIFATAEVTTVALTRELGQPGAASLVIGVYAAGSFIVGLILGALNLKAPLHRQLLIALGVLLVTTLPLLLVGSVPALTAAIFLSGVAVSPTFITAFGLIERRVPAEVLTEGVTWVMTGIGIGMALGAFLAGWVVDTFGPQSGFWVSVAAASLALLIALLGQRELAGARAV